MKGPGAAAKLAPWLEGKVRRRNYESWPEWRGEHTIVSALDP